MQERLQTSNRYFSLYHPNLYINTFEIGWVYWFLTSIQVEHILSLKFQTNLQVQTTSMYRIEKKHEIYLFNLFIYSYIVGSILFSNKM